MKDGHVTTELFSDETLPPVVESLALQTAKPPNNPNTGVPVYLTIDMDVLDPSEFPGTGTQEAGGFRYLNLLTDLLLICKRLNVVGIDNVELNPGLDPSGRSTALACKFLREELLALRV